ncbi:MAG: hypothetical protein OHK0017_12740 [Patescibacteria group bacterium]
MTGVLVRLRQEHGLNRGENYYQKLIQRILTAKGVLLHVGYNGHGSSTSELVVQDPDKLCIVMGGTDDFGGQTGYAIRALISDEFSQTNTFLQSSFFKNNLAENVISLGDQRSIIERGWLTNALRKSNSGYSEEQIKKYVDLFSSKTKSDHTSPDILRDEIKEIANRFADHQMTKELFPELADFTNFIEDFIHTSLNLIQEGKMEIKEGEKFQPKLGNLILYGLLLKSNNLEHFLEKIHNNGIVPENTLLCFPSNERLTLRAGISQNQDGTWEYVYGEDEIDTMPVSYNPEKIDYICQDGSEFGKGKLNPVVANKISDPTTITIACNGSDSNSLPFFNHFKDEIKGVVLKLGNLFRANREPSAENNLFYFLKGLHNFVYITGNKNAFQDLQNGKFREFVEAYAQESKSQNLLGSMERAFDFAQSRFKRENRSSFLKILQLLNPEVGNGIKHDPLFIKIMLGEISLIHREVFSEHYSITENESSEISLGEELVSKFIQQTSEKLYLVEKIYRCVKEPRENKEELKELIKYHSDELSRLRAIISIESAFDKAEFKERVLEYR